MSKLALANRVPREYDAASIQEVVRQLELQANQQAEGKLKARHGAMTAAPTVGNWEKGDLADNSSPSVVASDIADYVIMGWVCTASGTPGTWKERRVLVEDITAAVLSAEIASTSGTSIDFTGIPTWVKKIVVQFVGVSTNGTSAVLVQLGDAGGIETTGYLGSGSVYATAISSANFTAGFGVGQGGAAAATYHGTVTLTLEDAANFTWVATGMLTESNAAEGHSSSGSKALSATLDRVRITTAGGVNTFDAGVLAVLME